MFFTKKKVRCLPEAKGPYVPGCIDIMLEYSQTGIFARLYYPTNENRHEIESSRWIPWIPYENYFVDSMKALAFLPVVARLFCWCTSVSNWLTPVLYGAKVKTNKKLQCIILSHGYAGNRLYYSVVCNELASRGYLVASIEHRDGTAGYTYFYKSKEDAAADIKTSIPSIKFHFNENFYTERNKQAKYRANECCKLLDLLYDLNNGKIPYNILNDLEKDVNFDWNSFVGLLDLSSISIIGHSFGGATALYTLSLRKELKQGIIMDPWIYPIKHEENLIENVTQPLIFINSQTFHTSVNVDEMAKYMDSDKREMYTILHTTHEIQSDMANVSGYWMNPFTRKISPSQAADINNGLILRFLKKYTKNDESMDDCEYYLKEEQKNIASGLTKPRTHIAT